MTTGRTPLRRSMRVLLIILGSASLGLGVIGMFVPVWPTTPFLLLAAVCYAHSSERFYRGLLSNRWVGGYIAGYREGRGLSIRQKAITIALLWLTIGSTAWLAVSRWWVRGVLLGIAAAVTIHLLAIRTHRPEAPRGR